MVSIPGYRIRGDIGKNRTRHLFRALDTSNNEDVILKIIPHGASIREELHRQQRDYTISRSINSKYVLTPYRIEPHPDHLVMVMEDFEGFASHIVVHTHNSDVKKIISLCISAAKAVADIHKRNILHGGIGPGCILYNQERKLVKLIDFGLAVEGKMRKSRFFNLGVISSNLAYLSPEQTGRMNRPVDTRADLYSFGVTMYFWLTEKLPFVHADPAEMIHSHVAEVPVPPSSINGQVPEVVSRIVMKLLEKSPDERYQSASGLVHDLHECMRLWKNDEQRNRLVLGEHDISDTFSIPEKLYHREYERSLLLDAIDASKTGEGSLCLVFGEPGCGKSTLVHDLRLPIITKRGYFLSGKYEQSRKDLPYSAIFEAISELIKQWLAESDAGLQAIRAALVEGLGGVGDALTELIPDVARLIGEQTGVQPISSQERRNRLLLAVRRFIKTLCEIQRPVVLFLDDVHWIDSASLVVLQELLLHGPIQGFTVIGCYRDNEVDQGHPFLRMVEHIRENGNRIVDLPLASLTPAAVNELLTDTLHRCDAELRRLSEIVYRRTEGNPFFIHQYLKHLADRGVFWFNQDFIWEFDRERISSVGIPDSVADLMTMRFSGLPEELQEILGCAACAGRHVNVELLSAICGRQGEAAIKSGLEKMESSGLLVQSEEGWSFAHDHIQDKAFTLVEHSRQALLHAEIGRFLLPREKGTALKDRVCDIVDHLLSGLHYLTKEERFGLITHCLQAGRHTFNTAAFQSALRYLDAGIALLPEDSWEKLYAQTFQFHIMRGECQCFLEKKKDGQELYYSLLEKHLTPHDRAIVIDKICFAYLMFGGDYQKTIEIALNGLRLCGIKVSPHPLRIRMVFDVIRTQFLYARRSEEQLLSTPPITKDEVIDALPIILAVANVANQVNANLSLLLAMLLVRLFLRYGIHAISPIALAILSIVTTFKNPDLGRKIASVAEQLAVKIDNPRTLTLVRFYTALYTYPWSQPYTQILDTLFKLQADFENLGIFYYNAPCLCTGLTIKFMAGRPLHMLEKELSDAVRELHRWSSKGWSVLVEKLISITKLLTEESAPVLDRDDPFGIMQTDAEAITLIFDIIITYGVTVLYVLGEIDLAYSHIEHNPEAFVTRQQGIPHEGEFCFYRGLAAARLSSQHTGKRRRELRKVARREYSYLQRRSTFCPKNFKHKADMVQAEIARYRHDRRTTKRLYGEALESAATNGFIHHQALINERLASLELEEGHTYEAIVYMSEALRLYEQWGAAAKCVRLRTEYESLKHTIPNDKPISKEGVAEEVDDRGLFARLLDIQSVVKATQAISQEINLESLLNRMMEIIAENAGAQRGLLILESDGRLNIAASFHTRPHHIDVLQGVPLEDVRDVSHNIIHYVKRTGEKLILEDASEEAVFSNDPYITEHRPKSVLCLPFRKNQMITGVLYLENNLLTGAFSSERIEVLEILLAQAAISVENAEYYTILQKEIAERKEIQQSLQEKNDLNELLLDSFPHTAMLIRKDKTIIAANRSAVENGAEIGGYCWRTYAKRAYGSTIAESVPGSPAGICPFCLADDTIADQKASTQRDVAVAERVWEMHWIPVDSNTLFYYAVDITERKKMEETLRHHQQELMLADKMSSLGILVASVAHDINSPNNFIMLNTPVLKQIFDCSRPVVEQFCDENPGVLVGGIECDVMMKEVDRLFRGISQGSKQIQSIVKNLRDFSKMEKEKVYKPTSVNEVIHNSILLLSRLINSSTDHFSTIFEETPVIKGHFQQLEQVMVNLLINACQALQSREDSITVATRYDGRNKQVVVEVIDEGIGIPEEDFDAIIKPFYTTKQEKGGIGLGLSISNKIITEHNGTMSFSSKSGKGTTVRLLLPVNGERQV